MTTENEREKAQLERAEENGNVEVALMVAEVGERREGVISQVRGLREATEADLLALGWVRV